MRFSRGFAANFYEFGNPFSIFYKKRAGYLFRYSALFVCVGIILNLLTLGLRLNTDIISMAYSIYSSRRVYALLLGSGISRNAGISTGWEITMDLIRQLSVAETDESINNLEKWYTDKFNKEPDYSEILELLAKTPTERSQLLKQYFEPTTEDKELKLKEPTIAHGIIVQSIKEGFIKVIITTNFDKLLEKALGHIGITPNVISTTDQLEGCLPLVHSNCTIVKVHGDYTDTRIKNTTEELKKYDDRMNLYLDKILDEYYYVPMDMRMQNTLRSVFYNIIKIDDIFVVF